VKRTFYLSLVALLTAGSAAWAGSLFSCCNLGIHCMEPPTTCPDCSEPSGHHHCSCWKTKHANKLIEQLCSGECCCERIKAAEKLGCCLHADYHCDPEVLTALVGALEGDTCWEVRRAAARSIGHQNARTKFGVMALYLASKLDPHYMVRDAAKDTLDVMLVCRRDCYKDLFASADQAAKKLKAYYKPTTGQAIHLEENDGCFTVHVCVKAEEKVEKKETPCLVPLNIVTEPCPPKGCPAPGEIVPPPAGAILVAPAPGAPGAMPPADGAVPSGTTPEKLATPPAPAELKDK
jgi:hypothetical protein